MSESNDAAILQLDGTIMFGVRVNFAPQDVPVTFTLDEATQLRDALTTCLNKAVANDQAQLDLSLGEAFLRPRGADGEPTQRTIHLLHQPDVDYSTVSILDATVYQHNNPDSLVEAYQTDEEILLTGPYRIARDLTYLRVAPSGMLYRKHDDEQGWTRVESAHLWPTLTVDLLVALGVAPVITGADREPTGRRT